MLTTVEEPSVGTAVEPEGIGAGANNREFDGGIPRFRSRGNLCNSGIGLYSTGDACLSSSRIGEIVR
jgi:hypothetical protein